MNQRQVQPHRAVEEEGFLVDALAAADVDFAGQGFSDRERGREGGGNADGTGGQGGVAGDNDRTSPVELHARPGFEAHAAEHDDLAGGLVVEKLACPPGCCSRPRRGRWACSFRRRRRLGRQVGDALEHVVAGDELAEGGVLAVEKLGVAVADEKLAAGRVGVGRARHRDDAAHVGLGVELGLDLVAGAAGAGHAGLARLGVGAAALDHEALDDAVKRGAVIEALAGELLEIFDRLRARRRARRRWSFRRRRS